MQSLTIELAEARSVLEVAREAQGSALYDQKDSTEEASATRRASDHLAALESALNVAIQKESDAARALELAECDLKVAAKDEARASVCALTEEGEELFIRIKLFRAELVRQTEAMRAAGGSPFWPNDADIREIRDYFDFFMERANRPGASAAADSKEIKYPSWTYCVEYVCGKLQP